jgi:hypothetical protein
MYLFTSKRRWLNSVVENAVETADPKLFFKAAIWFNVSAFIMSPVCMLEGFAMDTTEMNRMKFKVTKAVISFVVFILILNILFRVVFNDRFVLLECV